MTRRSSAAPASTLVPPAACWGASATCNTTPVAQLDSAKMHSRLDDFELQTSGDQVLEKLSKLAMTLAAHLRALPETARSHSADSHVSTGKAVDDLVVGRGNFRLQTS